jgi:hypothetical protein
MVFPTVVATETHTVNGVRRSAASQDGEASGDIGETLPAFVGHSSGLVHCLSHPADARASGYPLEGVQRLFTKLA